MSADNGTIIKNAGNKYQLYYYQGDYTDKIAESETLDTLLELVENEYYDTEYGLSLGGFTAD